MKIIECPRDAMQGLAAFIPTAEKVRYINQLLKVGFDTIDFGSFVSPKAIPQMRDTKEVLAGLEWRKSKTKLLAIIANIRGAEEAAAEAGVTYLGYPLSVSETFQRRNTNRSIVDAINELEQIQEICRNAKKRLVVYISMGFGNPYGDPYSEDIVARFVDILITLDVKIISLADTIGVAANEQIGTLFRSLAARFPGVELGVHLHSRPGTASEKVQVAAEAKCQRFDGAIRGYGGCPMAKDELVGNIATEKIVAYFESNGFSTGVDTEAFANAIRMAGEIFPG